MNVVVGKVLPFKFMLEELKERFNQNYFELFKLPLSYDIDAIELKSNYLELQKIYHPDKFVDASPELKTLVLSLSSHINQAYNVLISPLLRGLYLLKLNNIELDLAKDTQLSSEFILLQMEFHDKIDMAVGNHDFLALETIEAEILSTELSIIKKINQLFEGELYSQIVDYLKQLKFYERLKNTLSNAFVKFT